ncbi:MAG: hypothetical protein ACO208_06610, partial [Candidatus Puniceispirillaceae bacterium]
MRPKVSMVLAYKKAWENAFSAYLAASISTELIRRSKRMSQSENVPGKPEFKQLWPTQFMSLSLPGHDTANPVLSNHLLE